MYLTPDAPTRIGFYSLSVPDTFYSLVSGALQALSDESNYEPYGTLTPEQAAQEGFTILSSWLRGRAGLSVGMIIPYVSKNIPPGCLPCDGSSYPQADFPRLASVIAPGFLSGSDIITPDLTARFPLGEGNGRSVGDVGGAEEHTLTVFEMPEHDHLYTAAVASTTTVGTGAPQPTATAAGGVTDDAGSGQAHNNMPPFLVLKYCIVAE